MRLIDADVLKENVSNGGKILIDENVLDCESLHDVLVYLLERVQNCIVGMIDECPTAYDVDGVVRKLENASTETFGHIEVLNLIRAIEIVRRGGKK